MTGTSPFRPRTILAWVAVAAVLFAVPTIQDSLGTPLYHIIFLYSVFFWITQATSWNIFSGYSGYFSFGQGAFYGAGVYCTAILVTRHDFTLLPSLPVGAIVGALIALASGVLVFRLRRLTGEIFALFSLAIALGLGALANNWGAIDGGRGITLGSVDYPEFLGDTNQMLYYVALVLMLGAVFLAFSIQHSRFGFGLFAIRDDERVASGLGVPALRYKLLIFSLNGAIAGISGALHAVQINFVSPASAFGIRIPLFVIVMSVVGGRRHWLGPVVGAVLIYTVNDRLVGAGLAEVAQMLLAVVLILATVFLKGGIIVRLRERPWLALGAGAVVLAVQIVVLDSSIITDAAVAMMVALATLFLPERVYELIPGVRTPSERSDDSGPEEEAVEGEDDDRVTHT
ncbi:branched-chain amino acid ABC transporter permease [Egibacter rhizosphaerae]|uniref:Branched-chain amino acid ABC transporter permease n=1 Tax=Egibacter rhizosphaerae TaxID=1670831 RepID=A0A411YIL1_9ACTN|nr:branched-chain amino acid ABC transporter permease [Egibacter rhizosphaerae]QBI20912.1 branched-chain amino acid ABC transporter permease [Egibacter rhizosphaerae]